jgi:hypothetical protein
VVAVEFASARLLEERDLLQRKSGLGLRRVKIPKKRIAWEFQTGCRGDATYSSRLAISVPKSNESLYPHCLQKTRCRLCRAEIARRQLGTGAAAAICREFLAVTLIKYKLWRHAFCLFGCALQPLCKVANAGNHQRSSPLRYQSRAFEGLQLSRHHLSPCAHPCRNVRMHRRRGHHASTLITRIRSGPPQQLCVNSVFDVHRAEFVHSLSQRTDACDQKL